MFKFEKIEERDVDLIIMRSLVYVREFAELFLNKCGWVGAKIVEVEHSLTDAELGESDVTALVEYNGCTYGLLIENKINAYAMENQSGRYYERGERGKIAGKYTEFAVFITAPQKYLDTDYEAQKYTYAVSYESMLDVFKTLGLEFEQAAIETAIKKKESGYTVQVNEPITEFWNELYEYVKKSGFGVEMKPINGAKGSKSLWVYFNIPMRGVFLVFKSDQGTVELEFTGKLSELSRFQTDLNKYKDSDMHWKPAGKSLDLYIEVKKVDFKKPFDQYRDEINEMLSSAKRLKDFVLAINDSGYVI